MVNPYLLDTNAYFLFLQSPKTQTCIDLENTLRNTGVISFFISEITSMEIHSVLGKYRRGSPRQLQRCDRVLEKKTSEDCIWISPGRRPLTARLFRHLQKVISDMECQRGDIQASIIKIDEDSITEARDLLRKYADHYNFSSHDALIGGVALKAKEERGLQLTVVTSDKGLKSALRDESMLILDPNAL